MEINMTPEGNGVVKVRLVDRDQEQVYTFLGYVRSSDFEIRSNDDGWVDEWRVAKPNYRYVLELDTRDLRVETFDALFASYPQRYVLGMDKPEAEIETEEPTPEPEDFPQDWVDLSEKD